MLAKLVNITTITVGLIVILNILLDGVVNHKKNWGGYHFMVDQKRVKIIGMTHTIMVNHILKKMYG